MDGIFDAIASRVFAPGLFDSDPKKTLMRYATPGMLAQMTPEQQEQYGRMIQSNLSAFRGRSLQGPAIQKMIWDDMAQQQAMAAQREADAALNGPAPGAAPAPGPITPQQALGDPSAGPAGPTPQRAGLIGQQPAQPAQPQQTPEQIKAARYRKAGMALAKVDPQKAKVYMDYAERLDPQAEFTAPQAAVGPDGRPVLIQGSKTGGARTVPGYLPKPDADPNSYQEYQKAIADGSFKGGYADWVKFSGGARAPKNTFSYTAPGQQQFIEGLAASEAKALPEMYAAAKGAASMIKGLNTVIAASQSGTFSGPLAPGLVGATQFLRSLGINAAPGTLENTRLTDAAIASMLADTMASLGARGLTDKDMEILRATLPTIADDPQSRIVIAQWLQAKAREAITSYSARRERGKRLPQAELWLPPEIESPEAIPGNRPSLDTIFGGK